MKTFAQAAVIFMIVMVAVFVCFNLITGSITDNEAENTLSQAVEQALFTTISEKSYSIETREEFIANFYINLFEQTQSKAKFTVKILEVDETAGLLDVEVTETLVYPDGKTREVKCRKTVVFEENSVTT